MWVPICLLFGIIHSARGNCTAGTDLFLVFLEDSFGDGWNGNQMRLTGCDANKSAIDPNHDPITMVTGYNQESYICVPKNLELYELSVGGAYWENEISWHISYDDANQTVWHEGGAPYDYSTCPTPSPTACPNYKYTVEMYDTYGDGWEGSELRILDCDGNLLKDGITMETGQEATQDICLTEQKFQVQCGGGGFEGEISWDIVYDAFDLVVLSGGSTSGDETVSNCATCEQKGGQNLTVYVYGAHLPDGGEWYDPEADAYTKVTVNGITELTNVKQDNNGPKWKKYLYFGCAMPGDTITVKVYDEDDINSDDLLVYNQWTDWESWPMGHLKRLNDTTTGNSNSYHKEYYVEVAYFLGNVITLQPSLPPVPKPTRTPTLQPSFKPTDIYPPTAQPIPAPVQPPTPTPPTPTPPTPTPPTPVRSPTKAPSVPVPPPHRTYSPTPKPTKKSGGDKSSSSNSTVGAAVGLSVLMVVVVVCFIILCQRGYITLPMSWRDRLVNMDVGMSNYSPMGAASNQGKDPSMNFNALRQEVRSPGFSKTPSGAGAPSGYVPPVLATYDDDEEEVSLGGYGRNSASV